MLASRLRPVAVPSALHWKLDDTERDAGNITLTSEALVFIPDCQMLAAKLDEELSTGVRASTSAVSVCPNGCILSQAEPRARDGSSLRASRRQHSHEADAVCVQGILLSASVVLAHDSFLAAIGYPRRTKRWVCVRCV